MEMLSKMKSKSITAKMAKAFAGGFAAATITFIILYFLMNSILDDYFLNSSYIKDAEQKYIRLLQDFVSKNRLSATDTDALREWTEANNITIFSVSRERVLIYDNTYVGNVPLMETDSIQLHQTWQYFHRVAFADGDADVYLYKNFEKNFYVLAGVVAAFISVIIWMGFFIFMVHKEVRYILLLRQEVTAMREGTLKNGFTQRGDDELGDLAEALNQMHGSLLEKERYEKALKADQEKLVLGMAHDLRTPLTGLMGYLEVCRKMDSDASGKKTYLEKSMEKAIQIRDLSDKLFEYFLSNHEERCVLEAPAKVEYVLGDYLSELCAQLDYLGFGVSSSDLEWRDVKIQIHSDYLGRIMNNIVSNIEKYADSGKNIILSSSYLENEVGISVSNYIKSDNVRIQGSQIGVSNILKMMQQMNGKGEVYSEKDIYQITLWFSIYKE